MTERSQTQADKFKQADWETEYDEDDPHWDERLKKVARAKPKPGPEE